MAQTNDLARILGEGGAADLVEGLTTPRSKQDAVLTDERLSELPRVVERLEAEEEEELRIEGGETLIITANFDDERFVAEEARLAAVSEFTSDIYRAKFLGRNTFLLEQNGVLKLPGVTSVPLAGLLEEEAALRLMAEPALAPLAIEVRILPVKPPGFDSLPRFGLSLFDDPPDTFVPVTDIPIPVDYVLGPGDSIFISLYGNENEFVELQVLRDGTITFPRIGPRPVAGMDRSKSGSVQNCLGPASASRSAS
jgi:protein involved in polysaccharide export with SLBB domain